MSRQLAEMHQNLLRKFERESKAMKRLSMNNEQLMWKLGQGDADGDGSDGGARATAAREEAGGMFMSATLPSRGSRGPPGPRGMSRSYDSPRAMFGVSGPRPRGTKFIATKQRQESTRDHDDTSSSSSAASASDPAASRLRRSGTYDVVENE